MVPLLLLWKCGLLFASTQDCRRGQLAQSASFFTGLGSMSSLPCRLLCRVCTALRCPLFPPPLPRRLLRRLGLVGLRLRFPLIAHLRLHLVASISLARFPVLPGAFTACLSLLSFGYFEWGEGLARWRGRGSAASARAAARSTRICGGGGPPRGRCHLPLIRFCSEISEGLFSKGYIH
jgi:hypothetical protein